MDPCSEKHLQSYNLNGWMVTQEDSSVAVEEGIDDLDAGQQNKTDRLRGILDKIDRESYKSIQCLKATIEAVDRQISTAGLPQSQQDAGRKREDLATSTGSRLPRCFFYNRVALDPPTMTYPATSAAIPLIPALDPKPLSDTLSISSPSTTSTQRTSRSRTRKQTRSRHKSDVSVVEDGSTGDQSVPVPGQLDGVFKGLRSLKVESQRLWTGLQQAREYANRFSTETYASSHSLLNKRKECQRDSSRRTYLKLLDCLDSSSRLAERLKCRINILEEKSQQKLSQIYNDLYLRQKFRLPPWPVSVSKTPALLLRAHSGLQTSFTDAVDNKAEVSARASKLPLLESLSYPRDSKTAISGDKGSEPGSTAATRERLREELLSACLVGDTREGPQRQSVQISVPSPHLRTQSDSGGTELSGLKFPTGRFMSKDSNCGFLRSASAKPKSETPNSGSRNKHLAASQTDLSCHCLSSPCSSSQWGLSHFSQKECPHSANPRTCRSHCARQPRDESDAKGGLAIQDPLVRATCAQSCDDCCPGPWCCIQSTNCGLKADRTAASLAPTIITQTSRRTGQISPKCQFETVPERTDKWGGNLLSSPRLAQEGTPSPAEGDQNTLLEAPFTTAPGRLSRIPLASLVYRPAIPPCREPLRETTGVHQSTLRLSRPFPSTRIDTQVTFANVCHPPIQTVSHPLASISCPLQPSPVCELPSPELVPLASTAARSQDQFAAVTTPGRGYFSVEGRQSWSFEPGAHPSSNAQRLSWGQPGSFTRSQSRDERCYRSANVLREKGE
ncbi:conserved hypothetical protein [Neospora caninum Liverpool]|nr:conserved hypothetical protein [Neospora caninum Liverpool]CBZ53857.1 conserved hypothetical protein [Neospora caninum Liverpool]|eukprot:XP_003883889.1 conserved hypothetical protein [Neospora caninum Liverpool]